MNLALKHILTRQSFRICDKVISKYIYKQLPCVTTGDFSAKVSIVQCRNYCNNGVESRRLPILMDFPPIMWPSFIKYIKNWMFANFIIRPYFEPEFSLNDFIEASKHAVQIVSDALQRSDMKSLEGLIEKEALVTLKTAISNLSVSQRQLLAINKEDIFYAFPYQVGVMFDDADKRWVEITMCYHVLRGLKQMQETGDVPPLSIGIQPEYQDRIFILNYRFIREFTKGVEDSWWINIVNHFQPHTLKRS